MKLAEALQERADLNRRIEQLRNRLAANATTQEKEEPAEDPQELLGQLDQCLARLQELITKINLANAGTIVKGQSLTAMIAERDCLTLQIQAYQELVHNASQLAQRATHSEIRIVSAINVRATQKKLDQLSSRLRTLDNAIQAVNWQTDMK